MHRAIIALIGLIVLLSSYDAIAGEPSAATSPTQRWAELRQRRKALLTEISDLEKKTAKLRDLEGLDKQIGIEDSQLRAVRTSLATARATNRSADEVANLETSERSFSETLENLKKERGDRQTAEKELHGKEKDLDELDTDIGALLTPEILFQKFKSDMSTTFAYLVGSVVAGFFLVALWDEKVRQAIFGGAEGIQFVTLFSIIIAVILFGITGILEGKELAALLGGLSGYILGRGTDRSGGSPPAPPVPAPTGGTGGGGSGAPAVGAGGAAGGGAGAGASAQAGGDPGARTEGAHL